MMVRMANMFALSSDGGDPGNYAIEIDLFEACERLDIPEAAAQWDASEIGGRALPDLRDKKIRLYYGQRDRWIEGERLTDVMLRMCIGEHKERAAEDHYRFEWSRSRGWIDINKLEAAARAAAEARMRAESERPR